jgi:anthranilate phosphoribosyltransferase
VVLLNAAAALEAAGLASSLKDGVARALEAIGSGAAQKTLEALREYGRSVEAERARG